MRPIAIAAIALCLTVSFNFSQDMRVIETGTFHGDEVTAEDGETWLGLYQTDGKFALVPSTIAVETVFDAVVDSEGEATGASVSVPGTDAPLFLVRGRSFNEKRHAAEVKNLSGKLVSRDGLSFEFGGIAYRLFVESDHANDGFVNGNAKLYFAREKVRQVLFEVQRCDSCSWVFNWAGDLDSDGKPDLYLSVTHHYNVSIGKLFLSSEAENGKLVAEVADFTKTGC